jgi:hypothetical protein
MVKVIAFREDGWMPPNTDFRQWDHLCRAYGVDLQMIDRWEEAEVPDGATVIGADEAGAVDVRECSPPNGDVVYVFGRSSQDLTRTISAHMFVSIRTPHPISMFSIAAGAILLEHLYGA